MQSTHRRRIIAASFGSVAAVGSVVAACTHRPPLPPGPSTTHPPSPSSTDPAPGTLDCGTISYAAGWPTTLYVRIDRDGSPGRCFLDAWEAGTAARLVTREQTDGQGGHILVTTYMITGPGRVVVTIDATGAQPPVPVTQQECSSLWHSDTHVRPSGCSALPPAAPTFDGRACGTIAYASGWPTTRFYDITRDGACLLAAWEAGTPARLVTREQTDGQGGHILIITYDVLGPGQLRVTTDPRLTVNGGPITIEECTGLDHDLTHLRPTGCSPLPAPGRPWR